MTNPTPLSPSAQAVVAAIEKFDWESGHFSREEIWALSKEVTAAALRAAADHVPDHQMSAHMLYAIADELETQ